MPNIQILLARLRAFIRGAIDNDSPLWTLWPLWSLFLVCLVVVLFLNPVKAGLVVYGIGKVLLGGLVGFLIDWCLARAQKRPLELTGIEQGTAWKCQSWIVCAAIIALALLP